MTRFEVGKSYDAFWGCYHFAVECTGRKGQTMVTFVATGMGFNVIGKKPVTRKVKVVSGCEKVSLNKNYTVHAWNEREGE